MTGAERKAIQRCARWLQACLELGWRKEDLDFLEALWWKHHDTNGQLKSSASTPAGRAE